MEATTVLLVLTISLLLYLYYRITNVYKYFEKRGVKYVKPYFLLGSTPLGALLIQHNSASWDDMYRRLKGNKIGGFFQLFLPYYIVRDPEYVNKVFISDFSHFVDRGVKIDEKLNPLDGHIFLLSGHKWRFLRMKLSPIFTTGKLTWMFDEMEKCGKNLMEHFKNLVTDKDIDIREDLTRFTTDVIGSCAFGMDAQALKNPDSEFRKYGKQVFSPTLAESGKFLLRFTIPDLMISLKIKSFSDQVTDFYVNLIKQAFAHRRATGQQRKDFVQLLLELREKGNVQLDADDNEEFQTNSFVQYNQSHTDGVTFELSDTLMAAQSFVFLVAGFETTASTLHYTTYLLSKNPLAQEKARLEVKSIMEKYGKIDFKALKEMEYLEKCINESLRLFPPVPNLFRECTKAYTFPDGTHIEKGMKIILPIYSLQRDPEYFPDPLLFKPERFDEKPIKGSYAPFGEGPRICIGKRFALIEMKLALAKLLEIYTFEPSSKTIEPIEFAPKGFTLTPKNPVYVKIKPLLK